MAIADLDSAWSNCPVRKWEALLLVWFFCSKLSIFLLLITEMTFTKSFYAHTASGPARRMKNNFLPLFLLITTTLAGPFSPLFHVIGPQSISQPFHTVQINIFRSPPAWKVEGPRIEPVTYGLAKVSSCRSTPLDYPRFMLQYRYVSPLILLQFWCGFHPSLLFFMLFFTGLCFLLPSTTVH